MLRQLLSLANSVIEQCSSWVHNCSRWVVKAAVARLCCVPADGRGIHLKATGSILGCARLLDKPLSFFDDYRVISGVPVFVIDSSKMRPTPRAGESEFRNQADVHMAGDLGAPSQVVKPAPAPRGPLQASNFTFHWQKATLEQLDGAFCEVAPGRFAVSCSSFSRDGSRLVTGHSNGSIRVWDANHGRLVISMEVAHKHKVMACFFRSMSNTIVISIDTRCTIQVWNTQSSELPLRREISFSFQQIDSLGIASTEDEDADWKSSSANAIFSAKRDFLAVQKDTASDYFVRVQDDVRAHFLDIYQTFNWANSNEGEVEPFKRLAIPWQREIWGELKFAGGAFSENGGGLLVGLRASIEDTPGFVVLWPNWGLATANKSFELRGTIGSWSPDGQYVVTWDPFAMGQAAEIFHVWDVEAMQDIKSAESIVVRLGSVSLIDPAVQQMRLRAKDPIDLRDEAGKRVLWCRFVDGMVGTGHNVASCVLGRTISVVFWDLKEQSPVVSLETGVARAWGNRLNRWADNLAEGYESIAVSGDRQWLVLYISVVNKGFVWNTAEAVQHLCFSLPDGFVEYRGIDIADGGRKVSMCGRDNVLLWNTDVVCNGPRNSGCIQAAYNLPSDEAIPEPIIACSFSNDGSKLGALDESRKDLYIIDFRGGRTSPLHAAWGPSIKRTLFVVFAFSFDGQSVVGCMEDNAVVMWDLYEVGDLENAGQRLATLSNQAIGCSFVSTGRARGPPVVAVCEKDGSLVWIDTENGQFVAREPGTGCIACIFSSGGETACVVRDGFSVIVYDLLQRSVQRTTLFLQNISELDSFPGNLAKDGSFAVVSQDASTKMPVAIMASTIEDSSEAIRVRFERMKFSHRMANQTTHYATRMALSDDGLLAVMVDSVPVIPNTTEIVGAMLDRTHKKVSEQHIRVVGKGKGHKEVEGGRGLATTHLIAVSGDGRRIANVQEDRKIVVWTAYATKGCIPDYESLKAKNVFKEPAAMKALLDKHGPGVINVPDSSGMSNLIHFVDEKEKVLVETMMSWALNMKIQVSLFATVGDKRMSGLQLAIERRAPEIAQVLLRKMFAGITTRVAMSKILRESLVNLAVVCPSVFMETIEAPAMSASVGEIVVPEKAFIGQKFLVGTSGKLVPPEDGLTDLWHNMHPSLHSSRDEVRVTAHAVVYPYPDCCAFGLAGILRPLLFSNVPNQAYSSDFVRSVILYKWNTYAAEMLMTQLMHHICILTAFVSAAIMLGHDREGRQEHADIMDGKFDIAITMFIGIASVLGLLSLVRKVHQMLTYCLEGRKTFWFWLMEKRNVLEVLSLVLVTFVIPPVHLGAGPGLKRHESWLVAITLILLFWKLVYFGQSFPRTAPLVTSTFEILWDITYFLALVGLLLGAFSVAFFVLFRNSHPDEEGVMTSEEVEKFFGSFDRSLLTTFGMMLGEFEVELFFESDDPVVSVIMFVLFMCAMMVVLFNLLIAIMGDSYD
ncbi:unnamed protein product, partial [Ostreobium quekettii]